MVDKYVDKVFINFLMALFMKDFFKTIFFHGKGKLVDSFNSITIIGNFSKGKVQGQAKIIYEDQSIYEG